MNMVAADTSWCQGRQRANSRLEPVSEVLEHDAPIPDEVKAFLHILEEQAIRPIYQADPDGRWDALQDVLVNQFENVLRQVPKKRTENKDNGVELLIQHLINNEPDDESDLSDLLDIGRKYVRRRRAILERRPILLEPNECSDRVKLHACASHTACNGFFLALFTYSISDFLVEESGYELDHDFWDFILYVMDRGGRDQYILLRAAENDLLDEEEEGALIEEGTMTEEDRRMEEEAHRAWLELQDKRQHQ